MLEFLNHRNFIKNKYYFYYCNIIKNINQYERNSYNENHHILPKSLGGSNSKDNVINISFKIHYFLHKLLRKFTLDSDYTKMNSAFIVLCRHIKSKSLTLTKHQRKELELARIEHSENMKINNPMFKDEAKEKLSKLHKGKPRPDHISIINTGENSHHFKGHYITPWGKFASANQAKSHLDSRAKHINTILNRCNSSKHPDYSFIPK